MNSSWPQSGNSVGSSWVRISRTKKWAGLPRPESFVWRIIGLLFAMFHLAAVLSPLRMMCMCNMPSPCGSSSLQGSSRGSWWLHLAKSQSIHLTLLRGFLVSSMAVGLREINRAPSRPCFPSQISFVNYLESLDQQAHASWPSCWTHHETVNNQIFLMSHKGKNKVDFPLHLCVLGGKSAEQLNCGQRMRTHSGHLFICLFFHSFHLLWV